MKKLLSVLFLVGVTLYAQNPKVYAGLGDVIYGDMVKISNLADTKLMSSHQENIDKYLRKCLNLHKKGLIIDRDGGDEKAYLNELRTLAKEYDFFVRTAQRSLHQAMSNNDYDAFSQFIKSGLIDIEKDDEQIIGFYELHRSETNVIPEVESYIEYRDELKKQEAEALAARRALYLKYKQRRIDQINRRQSNKKAAFAQEVEDERVRTKEEVYKEQKQELQFRR
ncbi:MAG: hypothetical protein U9Q62_07330 [Campylobacterota bacterium]|nr:hypothetical protein [Campylobacterota bacterium]